MVCVGGPSVSDDQASVVFRLCAVSATWIYLVTCIYNFGCFMCVFYVLYNGFMSLILLHFVGQLLVHSMPCCSVMLWRIKMMICCQVLYLTSSFVTLSFQETPNMFMCHVWWTASSRFDFVAVSGRRHKTHVHKTHSSFARHFNSAERNRLDRGQPIWKPAVTETKFTLTCFTEK